MKKARKIFILLALLVFCCNYFCYSSVCADSSQDIEQKINTKVLEQLNNLDFSNLNEVISSLDNNYNIFSNNNSDFKEIIKQIVQGKYFSSFDSVFEAVTNMFLSGFIEILPLMLTIIAISILGVIINSLKASSSSGVSDIVHFVCYSVIVLLIITSFVQIITKTKKALDIMQSLMEEVLPK